LTTFSEAFKTIDNLTSYLQSQGIKNQVKALDTARTLVGFLLEGKELPAKSEQAELPLVAPACPAPVSEETEDEEADEDE
jgi:hypothetical protein